MDQLSEPERRAVTAYLQGSEDSGAVWEQAYQELLESGQLGPAIRCTFYLGMQLIDEGEFSRGGGWIARGQRLVEERAGDCPERGYLLLPAGIQATEAGDAEQALAHFSAAAALGTASGDRDLTTLARHAIGRLALGQADPASGLPLLDEAMLAVTSGEVSPLVAGIIYCSCIAGCIVRIIRVCP